jgi:hypothetical protein
MVPMEEAATKLGLLTHTLTYALHCFAAAVAQDGAHCGGRHGVSCIPAQSHTRLELIQLLAFSCFLHCLQSRKMVPIEEAARECHASLLNPTHALN